MQFPEIMERNGSVHVMFYVKVHVPVVPAKRYRCQDHLFVTTCVNGVLMVEQVARPEMDRIIPGQKTEKIEKDVVQPSGFEGGSVAELMGCGVNAHESYEGAVGVGDYNHGDPA